MCDLDLHRHDDGPTACRPSDAVLHSIRQEIKQARALSAADVRLAAHMGLISVDVPRRTGFNDGLFYPRADVDLALAPANHPLRAARLKRAETSAAAPTRKLHALALLVDFSDNIASRPTSDFEFMLFDKTNTDSMSSLYQDMSYGKLDVSGEVVGWLRMPHPYTYYTDGQSGTGSSYPNNTPGLLFDALTEFCKTDNLKRFDVDGDGFVDGIFLIHAGGGAEAEPDPARRQEMIWSHKWTLPKPFKNQGVAVYAYSTEPEDGRVGVFAHEFGHVLGLPDLYDTSYRSEGVGDWCLMGGGSWGGNGLKPTRMSCWSLSKLGWIKPQKAKSGNYTLDTLANDPNACLWAWTGGKSGPEYFLIEYREASGRDQSLPGSGLAIWHIDENQSDNTNPLAYKVGLVQADGLRHLERSKNRGDDGDVFPGSAHVTHIDDTTTPSTRSNTGKKSNVAMSAMAIKAGKANVHVKV